MRQTLSIRVWIHILLLILVFVLVISVVTGYYTPSTSDAYLQANVVQIAPQVEGHVTRLYVKNNMFVKKRQRLFQIDPRPYRYQVEKLKAKLAEATGKIKQLKLDVVAGQSKIRQKQADFSLAQRNFKRLSILAKSRAIPIETLNTAKDQLTEKRAELFQAKISLHKIQQQLTSMSGGEHSSVQIVKVELAHAKLQLSETNIYAPNSGYIINMNLSAGGYAKIGSPVLTFIAQKNWWVVANIRENSLGRIKVGQHVDVNIQNYPGITFEGRVESIGYGVNLNKDVPPIFLPHIEKTTHWVSLAQRFPVNIKLINFNIRKYPLRVGATVRVTLYTIHGPIAWIAFFLQRLASYWGYI